MTAIRGVMRAEARPGVREELEQPVGVDGGLDVGAIRHEL
jgi:hypothetical protein